MAKFLMTELIGEDDIVTARLGAASGSANYLKDTEINKLVKLAGESRYNLCAVGDPIEARLMVIESAPLDDFSYGSVQTDGRFTVTFDGLQATPGTGTIAVGDFVVCGTTVPKDTSLLGAAPKVCKATAQPGVAIVAPDNLVASVNAALASVAAAQKVMNFGWRVVSLGSVGTGAVGTVGVIEHING